MPNMSARMARAMSKKERQRKSTQSYHEAKQITPRSKSKEACCWDTILLDIISQIVSSIANCRDTIFVVKAMTFNQRKGFWIRSSAELIVGGM